MQRISHITSNNFEEGTVLDDTSDPELYIPQSRVSHIINSTFKSIATKKINLAK
jgi:hypothetical protein